MNHPFASLFMVIATIATSAVHAKEDIPCRESISLNGTWRTCSTPKDAVVANPAGGKAVTLDDFEGARGWSGCFERTSALVKEGSFSACYSMTQMKPVDSYEVLPPFIMQLKDIPHDWSGFKAIEFWCHCPEKTEKAFITIAATSGGEHNYFNWTLKLDWQGWRKVRLDFNNANRIREPAGWSRIDSLKIYVSQTKDNPTYGLLQKGSFTLYFDKIVLIPKESLAEERPFLSSEGFSGGWNRQDFDDSRWKTVEIPRVKVTKEPANAIEWFRRGIAIPESFRGRRVILEFDLLKYAAWVWVNGKPVTAEPGVDGKYPGASHQGFFTACRFDVTDLVVFGRENVVAVAAFTPKYVKSGYDADVERGIAKDARLTAVNEVHVERMLIDTDINAGRADVRLTVRNDGARPFKGKVAYAISAVPDGDQKWTGEVEIPESIPAGEEREFRMPASCGKGVRLWTPDSPCLYHLRIALKDGERTVDAFEDRFGFRSFEAKGTRFLLNGKSIFLKGEGWILARDRNYSASMGHHFTSFKALKDALNINIFRCQMRPAWDVIYDKADEEGMMIMDEATAVDPFDVVNYGKDALDECRGFYLRELPKWIRANYNHPSIVIWSLGNEQWRTPIPELNEKYELAKSVDATRPIVTGTGGTKFQAGGAGLPEYSTYKTDVNDVHCYHGWYEKPILFMEDWIDCYVNRKDIPPRPLIDTETVGRYPDASQGGETLTGGPWMRWLGRRILDMDRKERVRLATLKCAEGIKTAAEMWRMRKGDTAGAWIYTNAGIHSGFTYHRDAMRDAFSPILVCARFDARNLFAGDTAKLSVYAINDTWRKLEDVKVKMQALDAKGAVLLERVYGFGTIAEDGIEQQIASFTAGDWPEGHYTLKLVMTAKGEAPAENGYQFFVAAKALKENTLASTRRILLLDEKSGSTAGVLSRMGVKFDTLPSIDGNVKLDGYDALIIGADFQGGFDGGSAVRIGEWVKRGGRCLALEQDRTRASSVLKSIFPDFISFYTSGPFNDYLQGQENSFVDVFKPEHPLFKGIQPSQFEDWNGDRHVLADGFFENSEFVEKCALAGVRSSGHWGGASRPGTVIMEFSCGKGGYLINQIRAVSRYGNDPVATKYLQNAFARLLSNDMERGPEYVSRKSIGPGPFALDAEGFIRQFLICGPFPNPGGRPHRTRAEALANNVMGLKKDYLRGDGSCAYVEKGEDDIEPVEGMKHNAVFPVTKEGYWNISAPEKLECVWTGRESKNATFLLSNCFRFTDNMACYAACYVAAPADMEAKLKVGSDDGYRLWLNRALVGEMNSFRSADPDREVYNVKLKKGINFVLMKITNDIGESGLCLRFTDLADKPLSNLKVWLAPNGAEAR